MSQKGPFYNISAAFLIRKSLFAQKNFPAQDNLHILLISILSTLSWKAATISISTWCIFFVVETLKKYNVNTASRHQQTFLRKEDIKPKGSYFSNAGRRLVKWESEIRYAGIARVATGI